jgi:hypothetical protein
VRLERDSLLRNCATDEGRPLRTGLHEQVSSHLPPFGSKGVVVSREGKGPENWVRRLPGRGPKGNHRF